MIFRRNKVEAPTEPARPAQLAHARDAERLLRDAMGIMIAEAAASAVARSRAGIVPGRPGIHYANPYLAGVDAALAILEMRREDAQRAISNAVEAASAAEHQLILGDDVGASARALSIAQATYDESDRRIATIVSFGKVLAERAAIVAAIADAEEERAEAIAAHQAAQASLARCGTRPTGDNIDPLGAIAARSNAYAVEVLAHDRCERAYRDLERGRLRLGAWERANATVADSLGR